MSQQTHYSEMVTTPFFRVSYCRLLQPERKRLDNGEEYDEYGCTALFPKTEDLTVLYNAYNEVMAQVYGSDNTKWPQFRNPTFRDGDMDPTYLSEPEKYAAYKGHIAVRLSRSEAPGLVYGDGQTLLTNPKDCYSGMWGRAQVCAKNYAGGGNIGIKFVIYNFQKYKDDESIGGFQAPSPNKAFGSIPGAAAPTPGPTGFAPAPNPGAYTPPAPSVPGATTPPASGGYGVPPQPVQNPVAAPQPGPQQQLPQPEPPAPPAGYSDQGGTGNFG